KAGRPAVDLVWPDAPADGIHRRDMAQQRRIGLALVRTIGTEAVGRDKAGMHVTGKEKGRIGCRPARLREAGTARQGERHTEPPGCSQDITARGIERHGTSRHRSLAPLWRKDRWHGKRLLPAGS